MRRAFLLLSLSSIGAASCTPPSRVFEPVVIGMRRGEQDAVDPADSVEAGTRKDLAASVAIGSGVGWVQATWTVWPEKGPPRVVKSMMFDTTAPRTLFAGLEGDTEGGWKLGTITCDFKTGSGQTAAGTIRVVAKR